MSRIGRQPVAVPAGVEVKIAENNFVTVKGAKGTLEKALPTEMSIKLEDGQVVVTRPKRFKENEIFTRFNKNTDPEHGDRCKPGI